MQGKPRSARYLISKGADINATGGSGKTPLELAQLHYKWEMIDLIMEGDDIRLPDRPLNEQLRKDIIFTVIVVVSVVALFILFILYFG